MSHNTNGAITRRGLFRGIAAMATMGAVELLPKVDGGYLAPVSSFLSPQTALGETRFVITVVSEKEVGINVVDVANNNAPVKGATVTITSRFNKESIVGITGADFVDPEDQGKIIFDISKLAETDKNGNPMNGRYAFNGTITVTCKGADVSKEMRDFSTGIVRVEGASGLLISTHALDEMDVYLERFTFNGWDLHYTGNTFYRGNLNKATCTFLFRFAGCKGDVDVEICDKWGNWPKVDGGSLKAKAKYDSESGYAVARIEGQFLKHGATDGKGISVDKLTLLITYKYGNREYYLEQEFNTKRVPIKPAVLSNPLSPLGDMGLGFTMPTGWPFFSNYSVKIWKPEIPFVCSFTPTRIVLGYNKGAEVLKKDNGEPAEPEEVEMAPVNEVERQADREIEAEEDEAWEVINNRDMPDEDKSLAKKNPLVAKISVSALFQGLMCLDWSGMVDQPEGYVDRFKGQLTAGIGIGVKASFTKQFFIYDLPCYISLAIDFSMIAALNAAASLNVLPEAENIPVTDTQFSWDDGSLPVFNFKLACTFTIGAGVKDVASIGISATGTLQLYVAMCSKQMITDGKPWPHVIFGAKFVGEVFVQLLLVKFSATIWSTEDKNIYNNWPEDSMLLTGEDAFGEYQPRFLITQADGSKRHCVVFGHTGTCLVSNADGDLYGNMLVATEKDDLIRSIEVDATKMEPTVVGASAGKPRMLANTACVFVKQEDGSYVLERQPCEGVNTFVLDDADTDADAPEDASTDDTSTDPEMLEQQSSETDAAADTTTEETPADGATAAAEMAGAAAVAAAEAGEGGESAEATDGAADAATEEETILREASEGDGTEGTGDANKETGDGTEGAGDADAGDDLVGDRYLGFALPVEEEYAYTIVNGGTGATCEAGDVVGIAPTGGIKPKVDVVINKGIFSDPRHRIVTIGDTPYLFRIITAKYPYPNEAGYVVRSRLAASSFNGSTWSAPKVLEYKSETPGLSRISIFDYSFDIVVGPPSAVWYKGSSIAIIVAGGLRPQGDDTGIAEVFTSSTISLLFLDSNLNVLSASVQRADTYLGNDKVHMITSPKIVDRFSPDNSSGFFAYSFIHRSADSIDDLMANGGKASFTLGYCVSQPEDVSFEHKNATAVELDQTVMEMRMVVGKAVDGFCSQSVSMLLLYSQGYDVYTGYVPENESFEKVQFICNVSNRSDSLPSLEAWPGHGTFLYTYDPDPTGEDSDPHIYEGTFDMTTTGQGSLGKRQVDIEGFKGGAFGVSPSGNFLFFIDSRDGWAGDDIDPLTNERTSTSQTINRIKVSKLMGDKFCEDFTFCDLDHPVDSLVPMGSTSDACVFLANEIIDADHCISQLHYIAVPHVVAAEAKSFKVADDFAIAGKPCNFKVRVCNQGNMIIRGFTVDLIDPDDHDKVVGSDTVGRIDPDKVMLLPTDYDWTDTETPPEERQLRLSESLSDGALMPGATFAYPVNFPIPEKWADKKEVIVRVRDAWYENIELQGQSEGSRYTYVDSVGTDGIVLKHFHEGVNGQITLHQAEAVADFIDPKEWWRQVDDKKDPEKDHDGGNGKRGDGGRLAKTNDLFNPALPLGLAVGGASALLAGYSARRAAVEREEAERHASAGSGGAAGHGPTHLRRTDED